MLRPKTKGHDGFTITELLVAIAIIVVLLGLLFPVLSSVWATGSMTKSMNNMRQISLWMRQYSDDNSDRVLPSSFDYSTDPYPDRVKVRSDPNPTVGARYEGSWADIVHSLFEVGAYVDAGLPAGQGGLDNDFRYDAPDKALYDLLGEAQIDNPLRSAAPNSRNAPTGSEPTPYGEGAQERALPGFFAANDHFREDRTNGEIRFPDRLTYLVDSFIGETVDPETNYFGPEMAIDFRYGDEVCLMLFLDGHVAPETRWEDEASLLSRGIRLLNEP